MKLTKEQWLTISINLKKIYPNDLRPNSVIENEYFDELKSFEFEDVRSAINKILANHHGMYIPGVNSIKEVIQNRLAQRQNAFSTAFNDQKHYDATPHIGFLRLIVRAHESKANQSLIPMFAEEFKNFWFDNMGKWTMDKDNFIDSVYGICSELGVAVEESIDKAEVPF